MEENKRKQEMIQELGRSSANDNIDIYFRRPVDIQKDKSDHRISTSADNTQNIYVTSPDSGPHSITSTFRRSPSRRDKIEIDSDNIETPPVTRKVMASSTAVSGSGALDKSSDALDAISKVLLDNDGEPLGNGQFDRFSSARKTRRYKRPTLSNAGSDDQSTTPVTPEPTTTEKSTTKVYLEPKSPPVVLDQINLSPSSEDKDSRLKRWQERLKSLDQHNSLLENPTPTNTTSRSSSRKSLASGGVNADEVKDAVHYLQRQTSKSNNKVINMELNDEGFEESQSLVSDTPSQGKDNNSGTETNDGGANAGGQSVPVKRMNSSESAITSTSTESKLTPVVGKLTPKGRSLTPSRTTRTQSLRSASATRSSAGTACPRPNLPIRQNSLRKNDSDSGLGSAAAAVKRSIPVQKSNSRNSLLSSRSSLNSAVSTNTVKKAPTSSNNKSSSSLDATKKIGTSSLATRLTPNGGGLKAQGTSKIASNGAASSSSSSNPSTSLSSMRSNNLTSASVAAQQLRDQLTKRSNNGAASSGSSTAADSSSVNNRLNLQSGNNYPLKGSHSGGGISSTNSINALINKTAFANPTNSTMNGSSGSHLSATRSTNGGGGGNGSGLMRKGSNSGSNFMRPTASSVTKASPSMTLGATTPAQKPSRFR